MKKKAVLVLLCLILSLSACGKEARVLDQNAPFTEGNCTYLEEGLIYRLMLKNAVYYEYDTGTYMPLCAKANCRHDGPDCTAVYFADTSRIGRLGNKWYRFLFAGEVFAGEYSTEMGSYEVDGGNEKTVADFPHEIDFRTICS